MLPFNPSLANQVQAQSRSNHALQKGMHFNNPPLPHQNLAAFNHPPQGPIHPHGGSPGFPTVPMPAFNNQNNHFNNIPGAGTGVPNQPNPMNHMGVLQPQGQLPPQFSLQNVNQMTVLQLLQQQQQHNILQLEKNYLSRLQNNQMSGAVNALPNLNQMATMQIGQNVLLTENQMLPSQFPQQQQQPLSSMQTRNVPPGTVGMSQIALPNSNMNFSNAMPPNKSMQFKNQNRHQLIAPTNTGQQQPVSSMQAHNVLPSIQSGSVAAAQMVPANSNTKTSNYTLPNKAMQRKNQNHRRFNASRTTGQQQPVSSMQTVNASPAQMVMANSSSNLGNAMILNEAIQCKNQNIHPFNMSTTQGQQQQQLHVNTQTLNVPRGQMVLPNVHSNFSNTMLHNEVMQCKPTTTGQQQYMSSMQTINVSLPIQPGIVETAQMVLANLASLNSNMGNSMLSNETMQNQNLLQSTNAAQRANQCSASATKAPSLPMIMQQAWVNMEPNGHWQPQVNHVADNGNHTSGAISGNSARKNIARNFLGIRDSQFHNRKNAMGYKNWTNNDRRGQLSQIRCRERDQFSEYNGNAHTGQRRLVSFKYPKKEVEQWRAARKRNFPTKAKIKEKRSSKYRKRMYTEAKLRRQELRKILAKQAELGVEVAEIPARYLKRDHNNGVKNHTKAADDDVIRRGPTLLQKLLSSDIKRDKSQLLQVFRFMVLNNFFQQWPDKPVEFPVVTIKDSECDIDESLLLKEVDGASLGDTKDAMDEEDSEDGSCSDEEVGDEILREDEKPEEGEIID